VGSRILLQSLVVGERDVNIISCHESHTVAYNLRVHVHRLTCEVGDEDIGEKPSLFIELVPPTNPDFGDSPIQ
jgi:hypothetical protein